VRGRRWAAVGFHVAGAVYTEPSGGAGAHVGAAGPRLAFVWQAQYTEPSLGRGWLSCGTRSTQSLRWAAAGFRVAGAVHQSFLEKLACAWAPLGRVWLLCGRRAFVGKAQYTEPRGGALGWLSHNL